MNFYLNGYDYNQVPRERERVEIKNPITNEVLDTLPLAEGIEDADKVLAIAEKGFSEWSEKPLYERGDILYKFASLLEGNKEKVAKVMVENMGRSIVECRAEVQVSIDLTRGFVEKAKHMYGHVLTDTQKGLENDIIFTKREPLGVFSCIIPFNAPVELFVHKVVPALIMGNAVIAKMPTSDPMSELLLADMLVEAGVTKEAIQLLYCSGSFSSKYITKSERIAAVTFTGSTEVGTAVYKDSAPELHRIFLEMGGNDPLIILDDADIELAAKELVNGRMMNSGQVCCSSKRTLVHKSISKEFEEKVKEYMYEIIQGDPMDEKTQVGSLVNESAALKVKEQIDLTINQGAQCVLGGALKNRVFIEPTLLTDVTREMDVAKDMEIFGPVITLIEYEDLNQAIEIANQTSYGLQASIISKDVSKAIAIAHKIHAGAVIINGAGSYRHIDMAFGGYKNSGIGREGISVTLEEYSQEKSFVLKNAKKIN
ncbi:aldehyde dehydrogenase family protein [Oceanobacillus sojae]|uniref:aldehyde dehydrogenase family protein n=1 Tax=Oceanobacillus sojae TaxID=582851 RepID=UPI0009884941|nr:aldehyde dehydrogenase family protein [Oceanobacillus sojae]